MNFLPNWRIRLKSLGWVLPLLLIGLFLLSPSRVLWQGRFLDSEYRLLFVDWRGQPLEGVAMQVLDKTGGISYCFPVSDFCRGTSIKSAKDGVIVFHHVSNVAELHGSYTSIFSMRFGTTTAPPYYCIFHHNGKEVYRCRYNDLDRELDQVICAGEELPRHDVFWPGAAVEDRDRHANNKGGRMIEFLVFEKRIAVGALGGRE